MNVSSSIGKGDASPQQKSLQSNYYQISPSTVQIATSNSPNQKEANMSAISSSPVSNYLQKPSSSLHQSRVASSGTSTLQTVSSLSNINQGKIIASSSNLVSVQQGNTMAAQVNAPRQGSVASTQSIGHGSANISGGVSMITTSTNNTLGAPMSIQQPSKRLSAADTTQILSSLQPCQPPKAQPGPKAKAEAKQN